MDPFIQGFVNSLPFVIIISSIIVSILFISSSILEGFAKPTSPKDRTVSSKDIIHGESSIQVGVKHRIDSAFSRVFRESSKRRKHPYTGLIVANITQSDLFSRRTGKVVPSYVSEFHGMDKQMAAYLIAPTEGASLIAPSVNPSVSILPEKIN